MKIYKLGTTAFIDNEGQYHRKEIVNWTTFLNRDGLYQSLINEISNWEETDGSFLSEDRFDAPMGNQEIWAAGVTYERSKAARMDEAKESGGAVFYDMVYDAERPELFFKATSQRCVGSGDEVYIRKDSTWNVPEPELTLLISSNGSIEGYTAGNDMSSRSIEGENPLYLPQAKVYEKCAAIGPCIYVPKEPLPETTKIHICIKRRASEMYNEDVAISKIKREFKELISFLFRECDFPQGVFLMTGTCLVPPDDFTLEIGDEITINIDGIGTLTNHVGCK
ncbi:fumarylacetoacetate hydrolase family protein [Flagellimonas myxillae]|uniref:fumarylacetoacetate hydrolase family protein n=1 Tax=Flagellimonas myxillae TaxID=2942214 RepID=UPI00201EADCA|nr:fumarylacetoacetate hydrolase family protein [Muricauda myxillae]MCL6265160.1 fumarylacetoacetate hydrolase family protein [Muricauda myxillae]